MRSRFCSCLVFLVLALPACRKPAPTVPAKQAAEAPQPAPAAATPAPAADSGDRISEIGIGDKSHQKQLLRGFYESSGDWRWTARSFAIALDPPAPPQPTFLEFEFSLPVETMNALGEVTITAKADGEQIARETHNKTGRYFLYARLPAKVLSKRPVEISFELDRSFKDSATGRDTGLIAVGASLKPYQESTIGREQEARLASQGYRRLLDQRQAIMPQAKQNEFLKLFHEIPVWRQMWFQNVQIEKNPLDLWMVQQIIYEQQPDCVIETGTFRGGSALYYAYTLNAMGLDKSRVFTVDIADQSQQAQASPLWKKYVTFQLASSTGPDVLAKVSGACAGKKTLVALDSDHRMNHVLKELELYSPLVARGGYLIVEDTHMDGVPTDKAFGPGPMAAVLRFLKTPAGAQFEQDLTREALIITFNPGGWLRRK